MNILNIRFGCFMLFMLFVKCASNPIDNTLNEWQKNQRKNDFWYGISIVNKATTNNIQETARNQAVADISSQIKIKISQDFKTIVEENNYKINQYSIQILESQINNNLEEVEIINFKDLGDTYMLIARLSKDKYYSAIERKRTNAKELALDYINKVSSPSAENFRYISKAESEISQYIDYPMYITYDNKKHNLYTLIQSMKNQMLSRISMETDEYEKNIKSLGRNNDFIKFRVFDSENNLPIANIPLFAEINDGIQHCSTNNKGECDFYINRDFLNKDLAQHMHVSIDQKKLYEDEYANNHHYTKVVINLIPLIVYLDVDESNLDSKSSNYIEPKIKEFLIKELSVNFTDNSSNYDLQIYVKATTSDPIYNEEYGIYNVIGSAKIDVRIQGQEEPILSLAINNERGPSLNSFKQAGMTALQRISDKIFNETLVELVSILKKN